MTTKKRIIAGFVLLSLLIYYFVKREKQVNEKISNVKNSVSTIPQLGPLTSTPKKNESLNLLTALKNRFPNNEVKVKQGFNGTWETILTDGIEKYKNLAPKSAALKFLSDNPELTKGLPKGIVIYPNEATITSGQIIVTVNGKYNESPFPFHKTFFFEKNGDLTGKLIKVNNHTPPIRKIDPCKKISHEQATRMVRSLNKEKISDVKKPELKIYGSSDATGVWGYNVSYKWTNETGPVFMEIDINACNGRILQLPRKITQH